MKTTLGTRTFSNIPRTLYRQLTDLVIHMLREGQQNLKDLLTVVQNEVLYVLEHSYTHQSLYTSQRLLIKCIAAHLMEQTSGLTLM